MERMLTTHQLAEMLGVHPNWVYLHAARGDLPGYKVGTVWRFLPGEVMTWLATRNPTTVEESVDTGRPRSARERRHARR